MLELRKLKNVHPGYYARKKEKDDICSFGGDFSKMSQKLKFSYSEILVMSEKSF